MVELSGWISQRQNKNKNDKVRVTVPKMHYSPIAVPLGVLLEMEWRSFRVGVKKLSFCPSCRYKWHDSRVYHVSHGKLFILKSEFLNVFNLSESVLLLYLSLWILFSLHSLHACWGSFDFELANTAQKFGFLAKPCWSRMDGVIFIQSCVNFTFCKYSHTRATGKWQT